MARYDYSSTQSVISFFGFDFPEVASCRMNIHPGFLFDDGLQVGDTAPSCRFARFYTETGVISKRSISC